MLGLPIVVGWTEQLSKYLGPSFIYGDYFFIFAGAISLAITEKLTHNFLTRIQNGVWKIDLNKDMQSVSIYVGGLSDNEKFIVNIADIEVVKEVPEEKVQIFYLDQNKQGRKNISDVILYLNEIVEEGRKELKDIDSPENFP